MALLAILLSFCALEALLFVCGVVVTSEAIRTWWGTYGQPYTNQPYRRRPRSSDKWQMEEGLLMIKGERHDPWQVVDQDENIL
jgi:putative transposase